MKYGTCKECYAQIPLMKAFQVEDRDVYECPTCCHPSGVGEMDIVEYIFYYKEDGDRYRIGANEEDGTFIPIAEAYSLAHARTITEALNEKRQC